MKKTTSIVLFLTLIAATSCKNEVPQEDWTDGSDDPQRRDTVLNNRPYRHYRGSYYPIYNGRIAPRAYYGASIQDISHSGFTPSRVSRGGFGGWGRSSGS